MSAATGAGSNIKTGRLMKEKKNLHQEYEELAAQGIYVDWGDNLLSLKALILGPPDTPYENGFFLFDIYITNEYPFKPPVVVFRTSDQRVRFHPNLYVGGKVCLSILGTWPHGPTWQSCLSIKAVLVTIQSIMNAHPLINEPGFEHEINTENDRNFCRIIEYETINVAIYRMLKTPPQRDFEFFVPMMKLLFLEKYDEIIAKLEQLRKKSASQLKAVSTLQSPLSDEELYKSALFTLSKQGPPVLSPKEVEVSIPPECLIENKDSEQQKELKEAQQVGDPNQLKQTAFQQQQLHYNKISGLIGGNGQAQQQQQHQKITSQDLQQAPIYKFQSTFVTCDQLLKELEILKQKVEEEVEADDEDDDDDDDSD